MAAIVVTLVVAWVALDQYGDPVSQRNAERIQRGMTQGEAIAIMGREPDVTESFEGTRQIWTRGDDICLIVDYDEGEKVFWCTLSERDVSAWDRFVRWFGW